MELEPGLRNSLTLHLQVGVVQLKCKPFSDGGSRHCQFYSLFGSLLTLCSITARDKVPYYEYRLEKLGPSQI